MHDGMQYDPIQGQGQGHEPLKVGKSAIFKRYLLPHFIRGGALEHHRPLAGTHFTVPRRVKG